MRSFLLAFAFMMFGCAVQSEVQKPPPPPPEVTQFLPCPALGKTYPSELGQEMDSVRRTGTCPKTKFGSHCEKALEALGDYYTLRHPQ